MSLPPGQNCSVATVHQRDRRVQLHDRAGLRRVYPRDGGKFVFFSDPDGNNWALQEVRDRVGAPLD